MNGDERTTSVGDGMSWAAVFPGQGSQRVGMGREIAEQSAAARSVFEQADEALGFGLSKLCWEGPEDALQLTENTQPAILVTSIALWRQFEKHLAPDAGPAFFAGHSLGEYSALVAAGALDLEVAVRLVRRRGQLMQEAVPVGVGAMAAVLGLDAAAVSAVVEQVNAESVPGGEVCAVSNFNSPEQTVIAGHRGAVERAGELAKERGAKRAVLLPVSAPFHSPLMRPARAGMEPLLRAAEFGDAKRPVVCNVDAVPLRSAAELCDALVRQIDNPVRWVESVNLLAANGVTRFVELGPGNVLGGFNRRIARQTETRGIATGADLQAALEWLSTPPQNS